MPPLPQSASSTLLPTFAPPSLPRKAIPNFIGEFIPTEPVLAQYTLPLHAELFQDPSGRAIVRVAFGPNNRGTQLTKRKGNRPLRSLRPVANATLRVTVHSMSASLPEDCGAQLEKSGRAPDIRRSSPQYGRQ